MSDRNIVLYETKDKVGTITLNRPERLNAITDDMLTALNKTLKSADQDRTVRAVLLTGAGRGFCAGQDITGFAEDRTDNDVYQHVMTYYRPVIKLLHTIGKPIIGAINGVAAGAGASLALACDLRIMSREASLVQAFSNIGLIPDAGSTWFLVRHLGYSRAFQLAIEAERLGAERCLALGLANRVADPETLLTEAHTWAASLAQRPTYALGLTKRAMNKALTSSLMETIVYEAHLQQLASESEDFVEGTTAFKEKRAPVFKGS